MWSDTDYGCRHAEWIAWNAKLTTTKLCGWAVGLKIAFFKLLRLFNWADNHSPTYSNEQNVTTAEAHRRKKIKWPDFFFRFRCFEPRSSQSHWYFTWTATAGCYRRLLHANRVIFVNKATCFFITMSIMFISFYVFLYYSRSDGDGNVERPHTDANRACVVPYVRAIRSHSRVP